MFNRTAVYKMLQAVFRQNQDESSELLNRSAGALGITKETSKLIASKKYSCRQADIPNEREPWYKYFCLIDFELIAYIYI